VERGKRVLFLLLSEEESKPKGKPKGVSIAWLAAVITKNKPEEDTLMEAASSQAESFTQLVRSGQIEWQPLPEPGISGVFVKVLRFDKETRRALTILLKFDASATYPAHNHPGGEEVFVLEGDLKLGKDHLYTGDYLYTSPNGKHAVRSENGCIVLVNIPEEVEICVSFRTSSSTSPGNSS
jgi:quercetin dioxygenase-like cupin family protein